MDYISTAFGCWGADSSSRFPFIARTHTRDGRTHNAQSLTQLTDISATANVGNKVSKLSK